MNIRFGLFVCALLLNQPAFAQRITLDDSLSPRQNYRLELKWNPQQIGRAVAAMINGRSSSLPPLTGRLPNVDTRLDTRAFVGQHARIYLKLPVTNAGTHSPNNLELSWKTRGKFLSGSVRPGQSTLVFEGPIEDAVTREVFDFVVRIENGDVPEHFILEPEYEIEITP